MARYSASQAAASSRRARQTSTPLFALRYQTTAGETVSVAAPSAETPAALPRGATAPCRYDPDDPRQVVLGRAPGQTY
jgi:hypothetical protein